VLSRICNPAKVTIPAGDKFNIARRAEALTDRWHTSFLESFPMPATQPEAATISAAADSQPPDDLQHYAQAYTQEAPGQDQQMDVQAEWEEEPEKLEREESVGLLDRERASSSADSAQSPPSCC